MNEYDKRHAISRLARLVHEPSVVGTAVSGLNLCDMYSRFSNRGQVLSILQERYPHALGEIDQLDAAAWHARVSSLARPESYVSGFAGEIGEHRAIEALGRLGISAAQYTSRVHEANDLLAADGVAYSVKSYSAERAGAFMSLARETPDSDHYVVNSELYERLVEGGALGQLSERGISVIDGDFLHEEATSSARDVLGSMSPDGFADVHDSVLDDVPVVSLVLALASVGLYGWRVRSGESTIGEFKVDLVHSFGRIGTGAGGSAAGSAVGGFVGSAIFPVLGTIIGAAAGGVLGAMGAGAALRGAVGHLKWGRILRAFDSMAAQYEEDLPKASISRIKDRLLEAPKIDEFYEEEGAISERFNSQMDPTHSDSPSLAAVLSNESFKRAERARAAVSTASGQASCALMDLAVEEALARYPRQYKSARRAAYRCYGSFILESEVIRGGLPSRVLDALERALRDLRLRPNHPYSTPEPKDLILEAVALRVVAREGEKVCET